MRSQLFRITRFVTTSLCILALSPWIAPAQDAVKTAPTMYKVISENENVRILEATIAPGAKTAMHSHPDVVGVVLQGSTIKWTRPDGKSEQSPPEFTRGGVQYMGAESHTSENVGKTAARVILVEFKKPAPAAGRGRNPSLPAVCKQVNDNPHARVFDCAIEPGGKVAEHTHGDRVEVFLTDATIEVTDKDGKKQTITGKKDTALYAAGPVTHSAVITGKTRFQWIVVEMK
jgi:quercetin dioxygenase-like cupin family protein